MKNFDKISKNTLVIIPAFNEEDSIFNVVMELSKFFENILVINDGSDDKTYEKAKSTNSCLVISHCANSGQGRAIITGIKYFLHKTKFRQVITFDGDGQHIASDAIDLSKHFFENNLDALFGSRFLDKNKTKLSFSRKLLLKTANLFEKYVLGINISDSHNGLRVLSRKACYLLESINCSKMAHATEIPYALKKNNIKIHEYPCNIKYFNDKKSSSPLSSLNIISEIIQNK